MADRDALRHLLAASRNVQAQDITKILTGVAPMMDVTEIAIYVVDYQQSHLMPFDSGLTPPRAATPINGTIPGRAFHAMERVETTADGACRLWLPLLDGMERLGVLEVVSARPFSDDQREACADIAALVAQLLLAKRAYGDAVELTRRRMPMLLAAEIVWSLLPPLTFGTSRAVITGILEPCYEVGGDSFDYAVNGDVAHVAVFDAMGHGTSASLLAAVAIGAYRNARRCGLDICDTYRSIDKYIRAEYPDAFVTAAIGELNCATGGYRSISAGHPAPLLLRDGRLVKSLPAPTALPLGLGDNEPRVVEEFLEPWDRILIYTDGVVDARSESGEFFGLDRLVAFVTRALAGQLPAPETMRRLIGAILTHQFENLQDDATALFVEWRGNHAR